MFSCNINSRSKGQLQETVTIHYFVVSTLNLTWDAYKPQFYDTAKPDLARF